MPKKRLRLQLQEAREKLINDLAKQIMEELKTFLSNLKAAPKTQKSIPNPQNPEPKTSTWNCEEGVVAAVVVGLLGFMCLSCWLGLQIGSMQVKADRDYQQAMEVWEMSECRSSTFNQSLDTRAYWRCSGISM